MCDPSKHLPISSNCTWLSPNTNSSVNPLPVLLPHWSQTILVPNVKYSTKSSELKYSEIPRWKTLGLYESSQVSGQYDKRQEKVIYHKRQGFILNGRKKKSEKYGTQQEEQQVQRDMVNLREN